MLLEEPKFDNHFSNDISAVIVQPTTFCNMECSYCYLSEINKNFRMSIEVAEAICQSLPDDSVTEIVWHGGEPLSIGKQRFVDLLDVFQEKLHHGLVRHSLQTNATLIDDDWCDILREYGFDVGVSIDGLEKHNLRRLDKKGNEVFVRVMAGIEKLNEHSISFTTISVIDLANMIDVDKSLDFLFSIGSKQIGLTIEEIEGNNSKAEPQDYDAAVNFWAQVLEWSIKNQEARVREVARIVNFLSGRDDRPRLKIEPLITVAFNGDVTLLSPELSRVSAPEYDNFISGNVLHTSLADLLSKAKNDRYVREYLLGTMACEENCEAFQICYGGHASNRFFENQTMLTPRTNNCTVSKLALLEAWAKLG